MPDARGGGVYVGVYSKDEGMSAAFGRAGASLQGFFRNVSSQTAKVGAQLLGIGSAISAPLAMAAIGLDNILGAFRDTKSFAAFGSQLADISARTNASTELLSSLGHAAKLVGADIGTVEMALFTMSKNIGQATKPTAAALKSVGVELKGLRGLTADEQFEKIAEALSKTENASQRAAVAQRVFGRAARILGPLLENADGMKRMRAEAERLGVVMGKDTVEAADELDDMLTRLKAAWQGVVLTVGEAVAPAFTQFTTYVTNLVTNFRRLVAQNPEVVRKILDVATGLTVLGAGMLTVSAASKGLEELFSPGGMLAAGAVALLAWSGALDEFLDKWLDTISQIEVGGSTLAEWWNSIAKVAGAGVNYMAAEVEGKFNDILASVLDWGASMVEALGGIFAQLPALIAAPINAVVDGINAMIAKVEGTLQGMFKSINDFMQRHPWVAKASAFPEKGLGTPEFSRVGKVALGGEQQVRDAAATVAEAMRKAAGERKDRAGDLAGTQDERRAALDAAIAPLKGMLQGAGTEATEWLDEVLGRVFGTEQEDKIQSVLDLFAGLGKPFEKAQQRGQQGAEEPQLAPLKLAAVGTFSAQAAEAMGRPLGVIQQKQLTELVRIRKGIELIGEEAAPVYEE